MFFIFFREKLAEIMHCMHHFSICTIILCLGMSIEGGKHKTGMAKIALQASNNTREASEQDNLFDLLSEMSKDFLNNNNDDSRFGSVDSKMGSMQSSLRSQQSVLISQQRILSTMPTDILSLKTKVANLGKRHCETGEVGSSQLTVVDESDKTQNYERVQEDIIFRQPFTETPVVMLIHKYLWMKASGGSDWFGWVIKKSNVSKSGFRATIDLWDTVFKKFWVQWVACSP